MNLIVEHLICWYKYNHTGDSMIGYIYKTTNKIDNKIYVGKKYGIFDNNYYGSGKILLQALKKYGRDNFSCEVLKYCETENQLNESEIYFIRELKPQYNIASGGTGGDTLKLANTEHKQNVFDRRSQSLKKKWSSLSVEQKKEWSDSISAGKKGKASHRPNYRHHSDEVKKRISESNKIAASIKSDEIKQRQRDAMARRAGIPNTACYKRVEFNGVIYDSVKAACMALNMCSITLKKRINNGKGKYL